MKIVVINTGRRKTKKQTMKKKQKSEIDEMRMIRKVNHVK